MEAGCALDRTLSVEVRAHGEKKWRLAEARTLNLEGRMVVSGLDPLLAYEFRAVASNERGSTPGPVLGPVSLGIVPRLGQVAPTVRATSSQTVQLDWSALRTGCTFQAWTVLLRRAADGGAWETVATGVRHSSLGVLGACPDGCAFKVVPELTGWSEASLPSAPVVTPRLAPPSPGAWRVLVVLQAAASEDPAAAAQSGRIAAAFELEVRDALGLPPGRVAVVEARRAQGSLQVALDVAAAEGEGEASAGDVVKALQAQLGDASSRLRTSEVGMNLDPLAGVGRVHNDDDDGSETVTSVSPDAAFPEQVGDEDRYDERTEDGSTVAPPASGWTTFMRYGFVFAVIAGLYAHYTHAIGLVAFCNGECSGPAERGSYQGVRAHVGRRAHPQAGKDFVL
mmetsp:Transcript_13710/g.43903  ORF Transcript_13710/g.43903 Transcript_13710/m.43903 type:complete len:396 (+) Transcript_13710:304-1491(+)